MVVGERYIMEHKHKLLATATSQSQGVCPEVIMDRFSSLPTEVAHRILSSLTFKQLTRLGSVSKRCREFYLSTPSFEFCSHNAINKQLQVNMLNSIDRFLICRGDNKIQRFHIYWHFYADLSDKIFRLVTWIHIAVRCNVEVLEFDIGCVQMPETLELPSCLFRCASLRSLVMKLETRTFLKVPSIACSTNLQHLRLKDVGIDEGFCKWISSSCKCIKELQLDDVKIENITIESSSLESFSFVYSSCSYLRHINISGEKLVDINIEWGYYEPSNSEPSSRSLNIFAPNLKFFKWIGKLLDHHNLGKFMCLEKAEILLKQRKANDCDFDDIFEVLCSICKVKVLSITEDATKALFREGLMPIPFDDISHLSVHIGSLNDDLVPAMVSLLRGMPNLNTLCIYTYPHLLCDKPKASRFNRKYWKSQNLAFVYQLQEVTIELSHGYNAVEFAMYIVEHAQNLKKMVIFYLPHQLYVMKKVNKSKKSPTATIVFQEKQEIERLDMCRYLYMLNGPSY